MRTTLAFLGACLIACGGSQASKTPVDTDPSVDPLVTQLDGIASKVNLTSEDGVLLKGTIWKGDPGAPAVVLLHQLSSAHGEWIDFVKKWAGKTTIIAIDLRGHGASTRGDKGQVFGWRLFKAPMWNKITNDVKAAVEHLRGLEHPPSAIGIVGASIGSSAALLYAAGDPKIAALVMLSPGIAYRGLDTLKPLEQYGDRPVMMVASKLDHASAKAVGTLGKANTNAVTKIYEGFNHGVLMRRDSPKLVSDVIQFVNGHLANGGETVDDKSGAKGDAPDDGDTDTDSGGGDK